GAMGVVEGSSVIVAERVNADCVVSTAGAVEEKRRRANSRIRGAIVIEQRARAHTSVEEGVGVGKQREPSKGRVEGVVRIFKGSEPVRGVAIDREGCWIWALWTSGSERKPKAGKHGEDRCEYCEAAAIFHKLNFPYFSLIVLAFSEFSPESSFPALDNPFAKNAGALSTKI